jgi:hypothetical protein
MFGIPIPGWLLTGVQVASGAGGFVKKVKALKGLATGSEAGVEALRQFEEDLAPDELKKLLAEKTNGKVTSLVQLYKQFAQGLQVDQGVHDDVKKELAEVRKEMPTKDGKPVISLSQFLAAS